MAAYDFASHRLFLDADLAEGAGVPLDRGQANYLLNVLRLGPGRRVLVFNGRDGEWAADVAPEGRRAAALVVREQVRAQTPPGDLVYLFAPLKSARLDYLAQKAVEMGASVLAPVLTRRTQANRVNLERLRANAVEAAEQCGILAIPEIRPETDLDRALAALEPGRVLVFCDEDAPVANPLDALAGLSRDRPPPLAVLIGPEGGFEAAERETILARGDVVRLSLGPRILRADTAAVAVLALVQAALGDWRRG
jgi:16S rRNA (uracil1498-N3)-methyltransferase